MRSFLNVWGIPVVMVIMLGIGIIFATVSVFAATNRFQYKDSYWTNNYDIGDQQIEVVATCDTQTGTLIYTTYASRGGGNPSTAIAILPNGCPKN